MKHIDKFRGKYRIASNRLPKHDYTSGSYFITICVAGTDSFRPHYFGEIMDVRMVLNELGMTAVYELFQTIIKRKNISIPSYVIMPDHVHFVVNITNPDRVETRRGASHQCDNASHQCNNETSHGTSLQIIPDSLGSIVNHFKGSVTRYAKNHNIPFKRQSNYYEHIIVDECELYRIIQYIEDNPKNRKSFYTMLRNE